MDVYAWSGNLEKEGEICLLVDDDSGVSDAVDFKVTGEVAKEGWPLVISGLAFYGDSAERRATLTLNTFNSAVNPVGTLELLP